MAEGGGAGGGRRGRIKHRGIPTKWAHCLLPADATPAPFALCASHGLPPPLPAQISASIVTGMASANWKERKAAMDEVEGLLVSAGNRIGPKV